MNRGKAACVLSHRPSPTHTHTHSVSSSLKTAAQVVFIPKQQRRVGCPAVLAASERLTLAGDISHLPLPTTTGTTVLSDLIRVLLYSAVSILRGKPSPAFRGGAAGPPPPPRRRPQRQQRRSICAGRERPLRAAQHVPPAEAERAVPHGERPSQGPWERFCPFLTRPRHLPRGLRDRS